MAYIIETMTFPVDNFLGMLLYAVLFMAGAALLIGIPMHYIPYHIPYAVKNAAIGTAVFIGILIWWLLIF
ncbi:hypothetical protein ERJ70_07635 [Sediminibacillus dalangtanensis]|uniref:Uncharacterized protein n=1 Tax=Sediminibacillus dalangtanensis TaxID=2729421 RepID=A0ABX7VUA4_9BACI|nr:hypothetical protein [Sediminibacillus dalangtanensis]QTM99185.1 hypothetical protein ERJ70_07635 [Sediminibacillus dalangtanensis]